AHWTAPAQWNHRHDTPALDDGMLRLGLRAEDVQLALYTLADRPRPDDERPLYLSFADLRIASMARYDWRRIYCHNTNFAGASLQGAQLDDAYLKASNLRQARLQGARLVNAKLNNAHLQGADLRGADLRG